jgi:hypothetical protein
MTTADMTKWSLDFDVVERWPDSSMNASAKLGTDDWSPSGAAGVTQSVTRPRWLIGEYGL